MANTAANTDTNSASVRHCCPVRRVSGGGKHHFFGYYNKAPWDHSGRYLLANRVPMMTGDLSGEEVAEVGYFDLTDEDAFHVVGSTTTWNWQMGCQSQWLDGKPGRQVIFNTRASGTDGGESVYPDFRSTILDLDTGATRELPLPVYVVAPNSEYALSVDYSRFMVTHRTIGYSATVREPELENAPADDGIWRMDIETGAHELILSLRELREFSPLKSMDRAIHWVTHMEISPNASRFLFIHRWSERVEDETCFLHRLFTAKSDGSELRLLECTDHSLPQLEEGFDLNAVGTFDYEKSEYQISHPAWKDNDHVVVWGPHKGSIHYHLYDEQTGDVAIIGRDHLTENGHMTYFAGGRWLLSDTYPDDATNERLLFLYDAVNDECYNIGSFYTDPNLGKHNRCDLHPRWHRDGRQVCIDSVHENTRQMYILDVESIVGT